MGLFHDNVEVVNRTSKPLSLRYDGQDMELPPNYDAEGNFLPDVHTMIPRQCIPFVLAQNPVMGSEDTEDPSSFDSLVGIIDRKETKNRKSWHDISFIVPPTGIEAMTRVNLREQLADDPQVKDILIRGRRIDRDDPARTMPFHMHGMAAPE